MKIEDILFAVAIVILGVCLNGCSFGMYADYIEDGSATQASYRRDRYSDVRSGMHFAQEQAKEPDELAIPVSPKAGWKIWGK